VQIQRRVTAGNAAQELIDLSEEAGLVVVGAKGHGGFVGMLLGSVSQHVLAHSRCTVVVVR
jgi:nucleotide-binding universal stress UspA family protein